MLDRMRALTIAVLCTSILGGCVSDQADSGAKPSLTPLTAEKQQALCEPIVCTELDKSTPYLCKVQIGKEYFMNTANSLCESQAALQQQLCQSKNESYVAAIHCNPAPHTEQCPPKPKACSFERKPALCQAASIQGQLLPWTQQPQAWGINPCVAKRNLELIACYKNLPPKQLGDITCEPATKDHCPPAYWCHQAERKLTLCSSQQIGSTRLEKSIEAIGKSQCDAMYKLRSIACRYPQRDETGQPATFEDIQCRTLIQQEPT